jgi:hypothetical protein
LDVNKNISQLATRARDDTAPTVNVTGQVLRRLRVQAPSSYRPLLVFTIVSMAAAVLAVVLSIGLYDSMSDPLWTMFQVMPVSG